MTQREQRVRDLLAESGLADEPDELVARLASLEAAVPEQPPEPSPQLAALLTPPGPLASVTAISRRPSRLLIASAVAFGTVAAGGLAAAANELPPGAQSLVADLSERYLPFELPEPVVVPGEEDTGAGASGTSASDGEKAQDAGGGPALAPGQAEPREAPNAPAAPAPAAEPAVVAPSPTIAASTPPSSPTEKQAAAPPAPAPAPTTTQAPGEGATAGGDTAAVEVGDAVQGPTTGPSPAGTQQPTPQPSPSTAPSPETSPDTSPDTSQGTPSGISTGDTSGEETTSAGPTNGPASGTDTGTVRGREGATTGLPETDSTAGDSPTSPAPSGSGEVSGTG